MRMLYRTKLLILIAVIGPIIFAKENKPSGHRYLVQYVNPFIGTTNGGNTFPGAIVPWGMVSVSPHNSLNAPSGYIYGDKYFYGLGHVHLSGTGCSELGSIILTAARDSNAITPENYKTTYSGEKAEAGYYSVFLDEPKVKAEATATKRCGITMFLPSQGGRLNILLDAGRSLSLAGGGKINIVSDIVIEGYNITGGFCGEDNRDTVYFTAYLSMPCSNIRIWVGDKFINDNHYEVKDTSIGCRLSFNTGIPVLVKIGISYVSIENARENLDNEIKGWDFNLVRNNARILWEKNLSRIIAEGGTQQDYIKFYTALYHMMIHPGIISDENGQYPLMGRNGTGKYKIHNRYSVFSLWDTYRTLNPFLTLVFPERESEIVKTMIDMYKESGHLPKWEIAGNETYMMSGDPASTIIADSYIKGIKDIDIGKGFEAMLKQTQLKKGQSAPPERAGYHELLQYGYIPFEQDTSTAWWVWGPASTTLEYCFNDWCIAQLAKKLGEEIYYKEYLGRSMLYKNLFDTTTQFIRPKRKDGSWLKPFNPLATEGAGSWSGSGGPGYVEGDAWNYTWFVPHDIPGLIKLFKGGKNFTQKLLRNFNNGQFTVTNEPDIAYPYLFTYVKGEEYHTAELVKKTVEKDFDTTAGGLPGNDDCGTISGWLVFSMLGFYPDCPAADFYSAGIPAFKECTIRLNNKYYPGRKLIIKMEKGRPETRRLETGGTETGKLKIILNGKEIKGFHIPHNELVKGGMLIFTE